ncbi:tripartite tricarboxylate transporter substrate-binding protein [Falsirhodobacter sp. 20TX0035]|uniref:tripartite tricarboxylate transporter substrate-binding protein n=1 Tax=Falsirhodobacter sp. 20TX0035 TaxID=3022019 RepID=UPI00232C46E6|nr:tripartite tricarboxylate transporter substrate-binding protein [Falsirhodobacter sp. 20TX0035]MDB6454541.1 tripartite tricarboxylate transporter substrate-binding protein [Falsirhodobacter sp. 20TX0035]
MAHRYAVHVWLCSIVMTVWACLAQAAPPRAVTCIAPAQPGGGFDLTCRLLADALNGTGITVKSRFMPGGVGAVAFNAIINQTPADPATVVAFSEGSIYNLSLGHYGARDMGDVRWLAALAVDYGAVVVRADAPWATLPDLLAAVKAEPQRVALGGGGMIGGQDWMRAATMAQMLGIDIAQMRFVAFEGGGGCIEALAAGFVQACLNDAGDSQTAIDDGQPLKLLAIHSANRLSGALAAVPTAREQGVPLDWPVLRGIYTGPQVADADVEDWRQVLNAVLTSPAYADLLATHHLEPMPLTGPALEERLAQLSQDARTRAVQLGVP